MSHLDKKDAHTRQLKKTLLKSGYSPAKRALEYACVLTFAVLFPLACATVLPALVTSSALHVLAGREFSDAAFTVAELPLLTRVGVFLGVVFADFMSGVVHWGADTWGSLDVPVVGGTFIRSFREHHLAPTAMCEHDVIETNGDTVMLTLPVLSWVIWAPPPPLLAAFWVAACLGVAFTNQFHKWAHLRRPSPTVAWLQRHWVILPPREHNHHHHAPYECNYCITTGWLNPLLTALDFWRHAEALVSAVTGWVPREDDYKWTGLSAELPDVLQKHLAQEKCLQ